MKVAFIGVVAGLTAAMFGALHLAGGPAGPATPPDADAESVEQAEGASRFGVVIAGVETGCAISRGTPNREGYAELAVAAECGASFPEAGRMRYWRELADGTVAFAEEDGRPVLRFAVADGVAYETYRPNAPLISLIARD